MNRSQITKSSTDAPDANRAGKSGISMPAVPVLQQKTGQEQDEQPESLQLKSVYASPAVTPFRLGQPVQKKANDTGLPDNLKSGVENLSGFSMDDVKVHYNSAQPAQLQAHAYAQGTDIHLAPGQEKHLPHEAWHVVQQKQGRVQATMQMKTGVAVNDDAGLESEADRMGEAALSVTQRKAKQTYAPVYRYPVVQRVGDKMALAYEDVSKKSQEIKNLQQGVRDIYDGQKRLKKTTRNLLDANYLVQSENLEDKQKYLQAALEADTITEVLKSGETAPAKVENASLTSLQVASRQTMAAIVTLDAEQKRVLNEKSTPQAVLNSASIIEKLTTKHKAKNKANKAKYIVERTVELAVDYGRHLVADPIVHGYEQGYKDSAMTQSKLLTPIKTYINGQGYNPQLAVSKDVVNISVIKKNDKEFDDIDIATLYLNEKRFVKVSEVTITGEVTKREVFKHRGNNKEYVQDAFGRHIKRYVKRALNNYDNPDSLGVIGINSDPRIKKTGGKEPWRDIAAALPTKPQDEVTTEISKHQREKEKQGGSPFISLTTTDRPIFGSSAKNFEGQHGVATIDLAKIPKNRVFDTHTAEAIKHIHNVDDPNPGMPFVPGDDAVARNSAARDSMRTRELVVAGDIPDEALVGFGKKGVDHTKTAAKTFQPPAPLVI